MALNSLLNRSLLALLGLTVVAFAFGYAMAGRVLSPLGRITRTAQRVAGSDLHRRIELGGPDDELKELADTFDEMLDRLDRAFSRSSGSSANASHELRTPLAINRTLLEVQLADPEASPELQQLGKTLLATNERSEQLVEGLLLLARSENQVVDTQAGGSGGGGRAGGRPDARRRRDGKGVEFRGVRGQVVRAGQRGAAGAHRAESRAERGALQRAGGRLGGGQHRAAARAARCWWWPNTGPVVPAYEVENLFEPFRRLRTERTGSDKGVGLGLSIVRSVSARTAAPSPRSPARAAAS